LYYICDNKEREKENKYINTKEKKDQKGESDMKMYRKRFIPDEIVDISDDEVLERNGNIIITRWKPIKPREDMGGGISYIFLRRGYKISKIFDKQGNFIYWYCDVFEYTYDKEKDEYVFIDLLADVKVYPNGKVEVLDFPELTEAFRNKVITGAQLLDAIKSVNMLIEMIQNDCFPPEVCEKYDLTSTYESLSEEKKKLSSVKTAREILKDD